MLNALAISSIDTQSKENGTSHNTSKYELVTAEKALVIRRGAPFQMAVTFNQRSFDPNKDHLKIMFRTGLFIIFKKYL